MLVDGRGRSGEQSGERQRKMLKRCEKWSESASLLTVRDLGRAPSGGSQDDLQAWTADAARCRLATFGIYRARFLFLIFSPASSTSGGQIDAQYLLGLLHGFWVLRKADGQLIQYLHIVAFARPYSEHEKRKQARKRENKMKKTRKKARIIIQDDLRIFIEENVSRHLWAKSREHTTTTRRASYQNYDKQIKNIHGLNMKQTESTHR